MGDSFYAAADKGRIVGQNLFKEIDSRSLSNSIVPETSIVWNGTPLAGRDALQSMLALLPDSKHTFTSMNAHMMPGGNANCVNVIIQASGRCELGMGKQIDNFAFSTTIVTRQQWANGPDVIQTINYRLVHKPAKPFVEL